MSSSTMPLEPPPPAPAGESPALSGEQLAALAAARQRGRRINRAAGVATFSGWTMAVFSFFSLIGGLFSVDSLVLGVGLGVVAYFELRGSKRLRALDLDAPIHLALNQGALALLVALYCAWGMAQAIFGPSPYDSYLSAGGDTADMMRGIADLERAITLAFYGFLLCVSIVAQSATAFYYYTRRRHLLAYLHDTPDWVLDAIRVTAQ